MNTKSTNPKDAVGVRKVPLSTVPSNVLMEVGAAMLEGARKYGRHNYREAGVRASVYYDGLMRHMMAWWEGQDIDPDSGLNHVTKAIATLVVLRDAMMNDMLTDDRPPKMKDGEWLSTLNERCGGIIDKYPEPKDPITALSLPKDGAHVILEKPQKHSLKIGDRVYNAFNDRVADIVGFPGNNRAAVRDADGSGTVYEDWNIGDLTLVTY